MKLPRDRMRRFRARFRTTTTHLLDPSHEGDSVGEFTIRLLSYRLHARYTGRARGIFLSFNIVLSP